MKQVPTASQTVGPFFHIGLDALCRGDLAGPDVPGERVEVEGIVLDGDGNPVPDALLEIWQADAGGQYPSEAENGVKGFRGFGRIPTDKGGRFRFRTIKPGSGEGLDGVAHAPHLSISLFMRGLLLRLVTRMYFPNEANDHDPVLRLVEPDRRATLIARVTDPAAQNVLRWNIVLQGEHETVFFEI
jgi:protocatechuate 3,4-dioxygenase alpha subunit